MSERIKDEILEMISFASTHLPPMTPAEHLRELLRSRRSFADMWQRASAENAELETRIEELEKALSELLHWIYPTEAHHEHRAEHFTDEARIGFKLIGEPHPFEEAAPETVLDSSHNQS
jgi:hypothetical protein